MKISDGEYKILEIIWANEPINSTDLCKECYKLLNWKKSTTYTMIKRLADRNVLKNENATVTPLISKEQIYKYESEAVMSRIFNYSLPGFLTAFLDGKKISSKDAEKLKKTIERCKEDVDE